MRIRQPEDQVLIGRREKVEARIKRQDRRLSLIGQRPRRVQHLALRRLLERVPHQYVLLCAAAEHEPPVGREAAVAAALKRARVGGRGRGAVGREALARGKPARSSGGPAQVGLQVALEGVEEEVSAALCADENRLAVVGELELGPALEETLRVDAAALLHDVDGGEGRLVVVSDVVHEDGAAAGTGDGEDGARWVVGGEVRRAEEQLALPVLGLRVPEADGVVLGAGDEVVAAGMDGEAGDCGVVAFKVADEGVVVGGQVADGVCREED